jgi:hypothetical protein
MKIQFVVALSTILLTSVASPSTAAEPGAGTVVVMECSATGPAAIGCAGLGVLLHELAKKDGFGPNGEIMKILAAPVKIIGGNISGADRETGELNKLLRASTGISILDIEKYGLAGGPVSDVRKALEFLEQSLGIKF